MYVAYDKLGGDRYIIDEVVKVNADGRSISVNRPRNWFRDSEYYLFITDEVYSMDGKPLNKNIRMGFDVEW